MDHRSSSLPWSLRRGLPCYPRNYKQTRFDYRFRHVRICVIDDMVSQGILSYDITNLKGDGRANVVPGKYGEFEFDDFLAGKIPGLQGVYESYRDPVMICLSCHRPHEDLRPWAPHHVAVDGYPVTVAWEASPKVGSQRVRAQSQLEPVFDHASRAPSQSHSNRSKHDRPRAAYLGEVRIDLEMKNNLLGLIRGE